MNFIRRSNTSSELTGDDSTLARLFVSDIVDFSSQYGKECSKSYTVFNLRGAPNHFPKYGDFLESCVLRTYGPWWLDLPSTIRISVTNQPLYISTDFVEIVFETRLFIESIIIYETYHPGGVVEIYAYDYIDDKWKNIWSVFDSGLYKSNEEARQRVMPPKLSRKFEPPLKLKDIFTDKLRIEFEHSRLDYYTEIDAVEVVGHVCKDSSAVQMGLNMRKIADKFNQMILSRKNPPKSDMFRRANSVLNPRGMAAFSMASLSHSLDYRAVPGSTNIIDLPDDILVILVENYLDLKSIFNLRSTCKRFYYICSESHVFRRLDLQPYWNRINDEFIMLLAELTDSIEALSLSWTKLWNFEKIEHFIQASCSKLVVLKLDNCQIIDADLLKLISEKCTMIESLSLSSCTNVTLGEEAYMQLDQCDSFEPIKNLKHLKSLNLYRTMINTESVIAIVKSCKELRAINLGSCVNIVDFDRVCDTLAEHNTQIESLDLWRAYSLTDLGVSTLALSCTCLKELDIGWWNVKILDCIRELAENCRNLHKLFLTSLRISDIELGYIAKYLKNLEQLDILGSNLVNSDSIFNVLSECKKLKMFDVSFCVNVDQRVYAQLCAKFPGCSIKKSFQTVH